MGFISPKQTKNLSLIAATLSIIVAVLTLTGLLVILSANTGQLAVLDSDAIVFVSPSLGAIYDVNSTVPVSLIFSPHLTGIDAPQATGYYLIAKVGDTILAQEESTGVLYTTSFTLTRTFVASEVGEVVIRATMTVSGTDYYNEVFVTIVSPDTTTTIETTTESVTGFGLPLLVSILVFCGIKKKKQYNQRRRMR